MTNVHALPTFNNFWNCQLSSIRVTPTETQVFLLLNMSHYTDKLLHIGNTYIIPVYSYAHIAL